MFADTCPPARVIYCCQHTTILHVSVIINHRASAILVGIVSLLVGLNALLIGVQWRSQGIASGATVQGTAGPTVVIGVYACGCCGPLVAKVTTLAAGPRSPYWLFVDPSSRFASVFLIGGTVLFTNSFVYATNSV